MQAYACIIRAGFESSQITEMTPFSWWNVIMLKFLNFETKYSWIMIMGVCMIFRSIYSLRNYNSLLNLLYYTTINIQRESGRHSKWLYKKWWPLSMTMNSEPFIFEKTGKTFGDLNNTVPAQCSIIYTITTRYDVR